MCLTEAVPQAPVSGKITKSSHLWPPGSTGCEVCPPWFSVWGNGPLNGGKATHWNWHLWWAQTNTRALQASWSWGMVSDPMWLSFDWNHQLISHRSRVINKPQIRTDWPSLFDYHCWPSWLLVHGQSGEWRTVLLQKVLSVSAYYSHESQRWFWEAGHPV